MIVPGLPEFAWLEHIDQPRLIYDLIRLALSFTGAVLALTTTRIAIRRARRDGWRTVGMGSPPLTLLSYALLMLAVMASQIELLGYPLTWRIPLLVVAVALGAVATNDQVKFYARPRYLRPTDDEDEQDCKRD